MGKAAENEKIKLRATLQNNCAAALIAGGAFLPMLALYSRFPDIVQHAGGWFRSPILWLTVLASLVAMVSAQFFHWRAIKDLDGIKD